MRAEQCLDYSDGWISEMSRVVGKMSKLGRISRANRQDPRTQQTAVENSRFQIDVRCRSTYAQDTEPHISQKALSCVFF
jgi:hypothetical protein